MTAYESYVQAAKDFREACDSEGVPMHRLGLMTEATRELWREKQRTGKNWLEEQWCAACIDEEHSGRVVDNEWHECDRYVDPHEFQRKSK